MAKVVVELLDRSARPLSFSPWCQDCSNVPGLKWDKKLKSYVGYPDAIEAFAARLHATKGVILVDRRSGDLGLKPKNFDAITKGLRGYQKVGVQFLLDHAATGAFLADDMGLGKTAQAIHAMMLLGVRRALVVCPAVVKEVWRREILKWWNVVSYVAVGLGDTRTVELLLQPPLSRDVMVVVANYEILHAYQPGEETSIDAIIIDEAHYISNERSKRSQAVAAWAECSKFKIELSGTPMNAREKDLFNPVNTISPGRFGYFHSKTGRGFADVYAGAHQETIDRFGTTVWKWDWPKDLPEAGKKRKALAHAELNQRLQHFMLRRTKAEVMQELPPRVRHLIDVEVPDWSRVIVEWEDRSAARRALDLSGQGKIPHAAALAEDLKANERKVVFFTHRRETAQELATKLRCPWITGELPVEARHKIISSKPSQLVATMGALSTGVDLTFADTVVFVDLDWLPSTLLQLESRVHRFGLTHNLDVFYLVGKGTLDERVRKVVLERLEMYEKVLGDGEAKVFRGEMNGEVLPESEEELLKAMREAIVAEAA